MVNYLIPSPSPEGEGRIKLKNTKELKQCVELDEKGRTFLRYGNKSRGIFTKGKERAPWGVSMTIFFNKKFMENNVIFNLKQSIGIGLGKGVKIRVSEDYETGKEINTDGEVVSVVLKNSTQIERFEASFSGGFMTIEKRGLSKNKNVVEDETLKKQWNEGEIGYITILAHNLFDASKSITIKEGEKIYFGNNDVYLTQDNGSLKIKDRNNNEISLSDIASKTGQNNKVAISDEDVNAGFLKDKLGKGFKFGSKVDVDLSSVDNSTLVEKNLDASDFLLLDNGKKARFESNSVINLLPGEKIGKAKKQWHQKIQISGTKNGEIEYRSTNRSQSILIPKGKIRNLRLKVFCRLTSSLSSGVRFSVYKDGNYNYTDFNNLNAGTHELVVNLDQYNLTPGSSYIMNFYNNSYQTIYVETSSLNSNFRYVLEYEEYNYTRNNTEEALIPVRLGYKENEEIEKVYEYKIGDNQDEFLGIAKGVFQGYTNFLNLVEGKELEIFGQNIFGIPFSHSENSIKKFIFKGKKVGTGSLKLDIYDILENGNINIAGGSKISKTINFSEIPAEVGEFEIVFDTDFTIIPDKKYAVILSCNSGSSENKVVLVGGYKILENSIKRDMNYNDSSFNFSAYEAGFYIVKIKFTSEDYNSSNRLTISKNSSTLKTFSNGVGGFFVVNLQRGETINLSGSNSYSRSFYCNVKIDLISDGFSTSTGLNAISKSEKSFFCKIENSKVIQAVNVYVSGILDIGNHNLEVGKNFNFLGNGTIKEEEGEDSFGKIITKTKVLLNFVKKKNILFSGVVANKVGTVTIEHNLRKIPKYFNSNAFNINLAGELAVGTLFAKNNWLDNEKTAYVTSITSESITLYLNNTFSFNFIIY